MSREQEKPKGTGEEKQNSGKIAKMGMLVALAMIFSYVEALIPFSIGIPGVKLGLANLVIVVGLYLFSAGEVFVISMLRILLAGLLFGNGATLIYSFAGGILSLAMMAVCQKKTGLSMVGISVLGGVCHNIGQLCAAIWILANVNIAYYLPVLMISGVLTGFVIGYMANLIVRTVKKADRSYWK